MIDKINRYFEYKIAENSNSIIVFGRRKTGKTFFVKNFLKYDNYFFVSKNNIVFTKEDSQITYEEFFNLFKIISKEKIIVVDEFHRLPQYFLDYIHFNNPKKIILLTSTLWLATKMLEKKDSSLLGVVTPLKFTIVSEIDILKNLIETDLEITEIFESAVYLREPIILNYYKNNIRETITNFLYTQKFYLKNLIGEIFVEEQRQFSRIYEGILLAISDGKTISGEISSYLFSKKLLDKDNPSLIQKHLEILVNLGLIEKIEVYNKKKFSYNITSPLLDLFFYLNSKYNYVEQDIPIAYIEEIVNTKFSFHIEIFFRNLFSKLYGLKIVKIDSPEIDISLLKFKTLEFIAEVKWRNKFENKNDLIFEKLSFFNSNIKLIISKSKINSKVKSLSLIEILDLVKKYKY